MLTSDCVFWILAHLTINTEEQTLFLAYLYDGIGLVRRHCKECRCILTQVLTPFCVWKYLLYLIFLHLLSHSVTADPRPFLDRDTAINLGLLPFYHIYGILVNMLISLTYGQTMVVIPEFNPQLFVDTIKKYRVRTITITITISIKRRLISVRQRWLICFTTPWLDGLYVFFPKWTHSWEI